MRSLSIVFIVALAACANAPGNVAPACRGEYDGCVGRCSQNPLNQAAVADGRGGPVHSSEERDYNRDSNASSCLTLCQSTARQCTNARRDISPPSSMPASH